MEIEISVKLDPPPDKLAAQLVAALEAERLPGRLASARRAGIDRLPGRLANARQSPRGVAYQTPEGGGGEIPHAFIVDRLGRAIFLRRGQGRLPIDKVYRRLPSGDYVASKSRHVRGLFA